MTGSGKDNLLLFPKTLDYYQIQLTRMLETERYGDAKALLSFLLQCGGEAERHHTEWQALLGWLESAFPGSGGGSFPAGFTEEEERDEEDWLSERVAARSEADAEYVPKLLAQLTNGDPERQLMALGQLYHVKHADVERAVTAWLEAEERHPAVQFRALQVLAKQGAAGLVRLWREGEVIAVDAAEVPLSFDEFPPAIHDVLERLRQAADVSDPTLAYFAEEMWKECVQAAFGTPVYRRMCEEEDGSVDLWAAALHQLLLEKLHGAVGDDEVREQYGITGELRFRYEQALRWLRQYMLDEVPR